MTDKHYLKVYVQFVDNPNCISIFGTEVSDTAYWKLIEILKEDGALSNAPWTDDFKKFYNNSTWTAKPE